MTPTSEHIARQSGYTVVDVVDGDTIDVRDPGSTEEITVRLVGIDAPESGSCEAEAATSALTAVLAGATVTLIEGGDGEDLDNHGRALRYVETTSADAGLVMIEAGHAVARYDSRDGYGRHDREDACIVADAASPAHECAPVTSSSEAPLVLVAPVPGGDDNAAVVVPAPEQPVDVPEPVAPAEPVAPPLSSAPAAPDPAPAYYANCSDVRAAGAAPIYAGEPGYSSKLDRDGDGVGCE